GIGQEREVQLVLALELAVRRERVAAHAEHHDALLLERGLVVAEGARLARAARRVVLRVEVQHHGLAAQVLELDLAALRRLELELRSLLPFLDHGHATLPPGSLARVGRSQQRREIFAPALRRAGLAARCLNAETPEVERRERRLERLAQRSEGVLGFP